MDELRAPLDRFPGGVLYHPGHLEILVRATMCEAPLLFIPFGYNAEDLFGVEDRCSEVRLL